MTRWCRRYDGGVVSMMIHCGRTRKVPSLSTPPFTVAQSVLESCGYAIATLKKAIVEKGPHEKGLNAVLEFYP